MVKKSNTEEFIKKAILIHGDKYDYSIVKYTKTEEKVIIICKQHGQFLQTPDVHLSKSGCRKCSMKKREYKTKLNNEEFIKRVKEIHKEEFDYSKTQYLGVLKNIIIICREHGEFIQRAGRHMQGSKCKKCYSDKMRCTVEDFIQKSRVVHGDKYCYDNVKYERNNIKVIIVCKLHGKFSQTPQSHLHSNGCPRCKKNYKSDTKDFIRKCKEVHCGKYDYSDVEYNKSDEKVNIICKLHGKFPQTPHSHLGGTGCPKCANSGFSKPQIQWLEFLSKLNNTYIQHIMNEGEFKITTTRYRADGYCKKTNTIYEFHGDYFHGNPKIYKPEELNTLCNTTFGKLYEGTVKKEEKIKKLGFNLVIVWESDWNTINKSIAIFQKRVRLLINNQ
jgi:hypothetical protein